MKARVATQIETLRFKERFYDISPGDVFISYNMDSIYSPPAPTTLFIISCMKKNYYTICKTMTIKADKVDISDMNLSNLSAAIWRRFRMYKVAV